MANSTSGKCAPEEEANGTCKQAAEKCQKKDDKICIIKDCKKGMIGCIAYSKDAYAYDELDMNDKMDFAAFMVNYDINKRKEFAEGAEDAKGYRHTASFDLLRKPQKIINLLMFIGFALFVVLVVLGIILFAFRAAPVKRALSGWTILCTVGIFCLIFLVEHLYFKVVDNLENIAYNIK